MKSMLEITVDFCLEVQKGVISTEMKCSGEIS